MAGLQSVVENIIHFNFLEKLYKCQKLIEAGQKNKYSFVEMGDLQKNFQTYLESI